MDLQGVVRRYLLVAAILFVLGLLALAYAFMDGHIGAWLDPQALVAAGLSLLLAGGWQLWALASTQSRAERHASALASELEMMASVAQHTGNAVIVTDLRHELIWCNQAFLRVTGYTLDEVRGRLPGPLLRSPNAAPDALARIDEALQTRVGIDIEVLHRYKDGRDRWMQLLLSPMQQTDGDFRGFVAVLVDIDEKVRNREALQAALRDSEALMQSLDQFAIVSEADRSGTITRVNRRFVEISGYAEDELVGRNHRVVNSRYHPPEFWQAVWERIGQGQPWSGEICNRGKDGRLYWVKSLIAPFRGSDGQVQKYISIRYDITAHKQAADELHTSRELLARTSRIAGVGGWYADLRTQALYLSEECRAILHIAPGQAVQLEDLWRHFAPPARDRARTELQAMAGFEQLTVDLEAQVQTAQPGQAQWVRLVGELDWQGRDTDRLIGAVQDITFQIRTQQRVVEEQRILRSAIDAVGEAFALYDQDDRLVYFNEKYQQLVSLQGVVHIGMFYENLLRSAARAGVFKGVQMSEEAWVAELLRQHREADSDQIRQLADGRWMRFIDRRTSDGYHVVFRIDVTELQDALLAADAAALSKGQFLANMSHEIRTPINAIMGLLQLLGYTPLDAQQAGLVSKARTASRSLLDILNDILDFSKVEAGKMELHAEPFDIRQLVDELAVILSGALGDKPLALTYEVDPQLPAWLVGDALRLKQVLINLGGNAIKFTAAGRVVLRVQQVGLTRTGARLRFAVEDTGIGIPPEQQRHIFSGFSQAEASTARRYGGTGLGLAISQRLVALMHSKLELSSTPGAGSVFSFELDLPLAPAVAAAPPAQPLPSALPAGNRLAGLRLLLVEDNALNREVALALLQREGATVTVAMDGRQAVQALAAAPAGHDLVLMDVQMPVLDGLQATREIRGRLQLTTLPIVAMTANAMQSDQEQCADAGMDAHVGKPFDLDELVGVIRRLTDRDGAAPLPAVVQPAPAVAVLENTVALQRLGGDAALLQRLRAGFAVTAPQLLHDAQQAAAQGEDRQAAAVLHQLKSSAGAVGAEALARTCAETERALLTQVDSAAAADLLAALDRAGQAALAALASWLAQHIEAPASAADAAPGELLVDLENLKVLLERADMEAIEVHDQLMACHGRVHDHDFARLNQAMEALDLVGAAVEVARLITMLRASSERGGDGT